MTHREITSDEIKVAKAAVESGNAVYDFGGKTWATPSPAWVALVDRLSQAGAGGALVVKPLVWRSVRFPRCDYDDYYTVPASYTIWRTQDGRYKWFGREAEGYAPSPEDAMAGAQRHHEAYVRASVEAAPSAPPVSAASWAVDALLARGRFLLRNSQRSDDRLSAFAFDAMEMIAALAPSPSAGEPDECETCVGTGLVEDPATSLSLGRGGFKVCPDCTGKPETPVQPTASVEAVAILRDLVETLQVRGKMMTVSHDDLWALEKRAREALASLTAPTQGDGVPEGWPPIGTICGISGANSDFNDKRTYTDARVIAYTPDGQFGWFQKDGCWPWQERLSNCLFRDGGQEETRDA